MARIYYRAIKRGVRTIEDVPMYWREDTQKFLDEDEENED